MTRLALALLLWTTVARADDKQQGASEFAEGRALYAGGDYLGAAAKFEAAFQHDPDPAYIFNVGQAYRRRAEQKASGNERDCAHSVHAYRLFLELVPQPPNRKEVDTYVDEMVRCAGKQLAKVEPYKIPEPRPVTKREPPKEPAPAPQVVVEDPRIDTTVDRSSSKLTTAGLITAGVGVVGVGLAGYYAYRGNAIAGDQDATSSGAEWLALEQDGKAANRNAKIFGVAGGVALGAGVVLYVLGRKQDREHRVTVVPSRRGAAIAVRF